MPFRSLPLLALCLLRAAASLADAPIDVGSRLELFADDFLIANMTEARRVLHQPTPQNVALHMDQPWEGSDAAYVTVFQDGDLYRMYYRSGNGAYTKDGYRELHREVCCYAESRDGIHWSKPKLGLFEFDGSKQNNIVWDGIGCHSFAPFKDANPACKPDQRYKAMALMSMKDGLLAFQSPDGIHWSPISQKPVITKGDFDSQNLAFWDPDRKCYVEYHRKYRDGQRDVMTSTSADFLTWTAPVYLEYAPSRVSELYTNQIAPYHRAPHLLLGFPTRYIDRGWTKAAESLPQPEYRRLRAAKSPREGTAITDGMFMTSRDGRRFQVWPESFIRPGLRTADSWFYGDNYQNWGLIETKSLFDDAPKELSVFLTEGVAQPNHPARIRRYTLRIDGFVSVNAPLSGGEFVTKPIRFRGKCLLLNYSTSAAGGIRVEIQDEDGKPIPGFTLNDSQELYGDSLEQPVPWKNGADLAPLAAKTVRLRFVLKDADLYSIRFQ